MKISAVVKDTPKDRKRRWRESNPEKHRKSQNQTRDTRRHELVFIGVDSEGMELECHQCGCSLYDPACKCEKFLGSSEQCWLCGFSKHDHLIPPCVCGCGKYDHRHEPVLLGCGDNEPLCKQEGIKWEDAFEYLYGCFARNREAVYVGFFLGYDFTQIFKSMPASKAAKLLTKDGQQKRKRRMRSRTMTMAEHLKGEHGWWDVDFFAGRQLMIRPMNCSCAGHVPTPVCNEYCSGDHHLPDCSWEGKPPHWMRISDVGSFFQTSLLNVIAPKSWVLDSCPDCDTRKKIPCIEHRIVTPEEWELLSAGKQRRSVARLDDEMKLYNQLENEVLSRIMVKYAEGLAAAGIYLDKDKWIGPGQVAGAWLKSIGDGIRRETVESRYTYEVLRAARDSYYGGWFEIMAHGPIPGTTYSYDINSAYPRIISELPCLEHGHVSSSMTRRTTLPKMPANATYRLVHATVKGSSPYIGTMPHRDFFKAICRPMETHGWFWEHELRAAMRAGLIDTIEIGPCPGDDEFVCSAHQYSYFTFMKGCDCEPPLAGIADLYLFRLKMGKNSIQGKGAKLGYNSAYGKMAQTIGEAPPFANPIYASLITAGCRTMILDAIATHPVGAESVVMVATDGVFFTAPHPGLKCCGSPCDQCANAMDNDGHCKRKSNGCECGALGYWEANRHENLTLFKPGVYWDDKARADISEGKAPRFKARGVNAKYFADQVADADAQFAALNGRYPEKDEDWPTVRFTVTFAMVSAKQAISAYYRRNDDERSEFKWADAGKVSEQEFVFSSNPYRKRGEIVVTDEAITAESVRSAGYYDRQAKLYRSHVKRVDPIATLPYTADYAVSKNENIRADFVTPDGFVTDHITEAVRG